MSTVLKYSIRSGLLTALIMLNHPLFAASFNGFDMSNSLIETTKILYGGPDKDGIPAIDNPVFSDAQKATNMKDNDRILGIQIDGISKAYPIAILNWHEIVKDEINVKHFSITYCPLCGTGVAFSSQVAGKSLNFGVSGLLYNSDVLLYDRQTESLWSQIMSKSISGELSGHKLTRLPTTHTSWADWRSEHPDTLVLTEDTGYARDYRRDPYAGYEQSRSTYFQVSHKAPPNYHPKERVLGLEVDGQYKAYPFVEIDSVGKSEIHDKFANQKLIIHWDKAHQRATISDEKGQQLDAIEGFWFAWFTFHPDTEFFKASR